MRAIGHWQLLAAARVGDLDLLRRYVAGGGDVDLPGAPSMDTALSIAIDHRQVGFVRALLAVGAACRDDVVSRFGAACALGIDELVARLLARSDASQLLGRANSAQQTALHQAADAHQARVVTLLLDAGASLAARDAFEETPAQAMIHAPRPYARADEHASTAALATLRAFIEHPRGSALLLALDEDSGYSLLHLAAARDAVALVRELVALGAPVDLSCTSSACGSTPFHAACLRGALDAMALLRDLGADLARTVNGCSALELVVRSYDGDEPARLVAALIGMGLDPHRSGDGVISAHRRAVLRCMYQPYACAMLQVIEAHSAQKAMRAVVAPR